MGTFIFFAIELLEHQLCVLLVFLVPLYSNRGFIEQCVFHLKFQKCTFGEKGFFWHFVVSGALLLFGF